MEFVDPFLCHLCGNIFYKLSTFESHLKWKHMEKTNEFMCDQCGKIFQKKYNLHKHIKSGVHLVSESVKCALCDFRALNRKIMAEHYQSVHFVTLKESSMSFKTLEEFYSWKSDFENRTNSRFVKMSSSRQRKNGFSRSTFFCHRDGNFISKGRNLRHLKVKGSNKINAHCPAKIDIDISERIVIVNYIDTHLGHELDISRMNIEPVDKALIAEKLALNVPFDKILEDLNNSISISNVKRLNLLTRKDLWNIVDSFKINPKSIVYNKGRTIRKIKIEKIKKRGIASKKGQVLLKLFDPNSSLENNSYNKGYRKDNDTTNEVNDNIIVCPVILKDDNDQFFYNYALISGETYENHACLIINSQGEVETVNGQHVICTKYGELQIFGGTPENDLLQEDTNNIISVTQNHNVDFSKLSVLGTLDATVNQDRDLVTHTCEQISSIKKENSHTYWPKNEENEIKSLNTNYKSAVCFSKTENGLTIGDETQLLSVNDVSIEKRSEYDVSISNIECEEDKCEYVIITENENSYISTDNPIVNTISHFPLPNEEITLSALKTEPKEESEIKEELVNDFIVDERHCVSLCNSDLPEWNEKRKEVLCKLLNVHNMINNEERLNVFC